MYELFPNAKVIFLYRSAADVVPSFIRAHENVRPLIQGLEDNLFLLVLPIFSIFIYVTLVVIYIM
jgi:hypothetical protein